MRKSLLLGTSTAVAMILTACTGGGGVEEVEAIYGPPPAELRSSNDIGEVVPSGNQYDEPVEDVYGPPVGDWDDDDA